MTESPKVEFTLSDKAEGEDLKPSNISLWQFNDFNQQVEQFLVGTKRRDELGHVGVRIEEGSYKLVTAISATLAVLLAGDLELLASRDDCLGDLDPRRAEVLLKWQVLSKKCPERRYSVHLFDGKNRSVELNSETNFHSVATPWVEVEKYILGTIMDIGGAREANIHVRPEDPPHHLIKVVSSEEYLREQPENLVYRKVLLHIKARQSVESGEMRDYQLVKFVSSYRPRVDKRAMDQIAKEGSERWADVKDPAAWVRALREGK